jgi:hypothetical protein
MKQLQTVMFGLIISVLCNATTAVAEAANLPDPTSDRFCVEVQKILGNTDIEGANEIFDNMPDYRASKPSPNPLMIYQVITYDDVGPIVVSCKVKTVDHLQTEYGEDAAGPQVYCPAVTGMLQQQAIAELTAEGNTAAATAAEGFVIDETEPYLMGSDYLSDFQPVYMGEDGATHLASPGLQSEWDSWISPFMPDRFLGQTYCHLTTVDYMKRISKGEAEPGKTLTTADDAPVTPPES